MGDAVGRPPAVREDPSIFASPDPASPASFPAARQRSHGIVCLRAARAGTVTRVADLMESGPSRLRFPKAGSGTPEGVLVNTAGGVACGDTFEWSASLGECARFVLTSTAAEKIYRSDGPDSTVLNRVALESGACLAWLPQETILFDRARLRRRFEADLAPDASLIVAEIVAFGRRARGERLTEGLFEDVWRVRRDGRLTYADTLRLEGPISEALARPAIGGGAGALATLLDFSTGAEARLDEARTLLAETGTVEAGASAWNGHLAVRLLGPEVGAVRGLAARFLAAYRGEPMPRVWQI